METQTMETKKVILKNCAPLTDYMSKINKTQIDNAKDIDILMLMYNLIEYNDNYSKTSGIFRPYYRDEPALNYTGAIIDFLHANNNSASFKFKQKITSQTGNDGKKDVEIWKYLSNFW